MKEINWGKYGSIAEVFGSIAVVITLLALLFEIQGNSELTKIAEYQSEINKISIWRTNLTADPKALSLFNQFTNRENMPEEGSDESLIILMTVLNLWTIYESSYISHLAGIFGENEWQRMESNMCQQLTLISNPSFRDQVFMRLSVDFTNYIESAC